MNTLLVLGLLALGWGLYALSRPTKHLDPSLKYAPVLLACFGAFHVWSYMAANVPVISAAQTRIVDVAPQRLTMDIQVHKSRQCRFIEMTAYVVDEQGISKEAQLEFLEDPSPGSTRPVGTSDLGKTLVISYDHGSYEKVYFTTTHICSFGIPVQSRFGETKIPEEFNK